MPTLSLVRGDITRGSTTVRAASTGVAAVLFVAFNEESVGADESRLG